MQRFLVIIPARGGSKRIKRKNLMTVDGDPLVVHAIKIGHYLHASSKHMFEVMVATDDDDIANVARVAGVDRVWSRQDAPDNETIGDLVTRIVAGVDGEGPTWDDPVIVIQPTSVIGVRPDEVYKLIVKWTESPDRYAVTVNDLHGLYWHDDDPLYIDRVNTQQQDPVVQKENGLLRIYPAGAQDFNRDPDWHFHKPTVIDIDTWGDLQQARYVAMGSEVVFHILAKERTGTGHLYRAMALADELQNHYVTFYIPEAQVDEWAVDFLKAHGWGASLNTMMPMRMTERSVWINDRLDTTVASVAERVATGWKVVNFEDQGPGGRSRRLGAESSARRHAGLAEYRIARPGPATLARRAPGTDGRPTIQRRGEAHQDRMR